jgi:hypothetical protein
VAGVPQISAILKLICMYKLFGLTVGLSLLTSALICSAAEVQLTGEHNEVLVTIPRGWEVYGQSQKRSISSVSLSLSSNRFKGELASANATIRIEIEPNGSCSLSNKLIHRRLSEFEQKLLPEVERVEINKQKVSVYHTTADLADYYYACFFVGKERVLVSLTVASGKPSEVLPRLKSDFFWTLQHFTGKDV